MTKFETEEMAAVNFYQQQQTIPISMKYVEYIN